MAAPLDPWTKLHPPTAFGPDIQAEWPAIREALLTWHAAQGRHDLPWKTTDPYGIWLSEVMLQQTQVSTGLVRYPAWMTQFPTIEALAQASSSEVMAAWAGLGYYARARNLHAAAQQMARQHNGQMPNERAQRLALPGVGPSTASAIGAFAFGQREAIFDGNVRRVWARVLADALPQPLTPAAYDRWLWSYAQAVLPETPSAIRDWTQAIMDLGATVCLPRAPKCTACPLSQWCRAYQQGVPQAFPPPKVRVQVKRLDLHWGWWRRGDRVAVIERPASGIWGGLWTPPERDPEVTANASLKAEGRQLLSHRRVHWTLVPRSLGSVPKGVTWVDRTTWEALPWPKGLRDWWTALPLAEREAWWAPDR